MTDMEALEALVGEWTIEVVMPGSEDVLPGAMSVEWLDGGGYLVQRTTMEDPRFPRTIAAIGPDRSGEMIVQHYFDSRGVARVYEISLENGDPAPVTRRRGLRPALHGPLQRRRLGDRGRLGAHARTTAPGCTTST